MPPRPRPRPDRQSTAAALVPTTGEANFDPRSRHNHLYDTDRLAQQLRREPNPDEEHGETLHSDEAESMLNELNNDLLYLLSRADAVKKQRDLILAGRAPMNHLPIELLARVFELGSYRDIAFASTVEVVCTKWRRLARNLPSIWGNIVMDTTWTHGTQSFHRKMTQCLARSGESPLLVDFDLCGIDAIEDARALLAVVAPHIARCYSFGITVPQPEWIELIGQCFGGALAAKMESMALRFRPSSPWAAAYVQSTILQGSMPLLHTLALEGLPLTILNVSLPGLRIFEYKQFEEIYSYPQNAAAVMPVGDLWHLLRHAPNIEGLCIEYCSFNFMEEDLIGGIDVKVALPRLTSLTVGHVDAGFAHLLVEAIDAPSLNKLTFRCDPLRHHQDMWWIPSHRVAYLNSLVLEGIRILDGSPMISLTRLLTATKTLKTLCIKTPATAATHMTATPQFFAALSRPTASGEWLCPELTEFTIARCNLVTGHELLGLIRAREQSRAVPSIQFLGIKECAAFDVTTLDELERCVPAVLYLPPQSPPAVPSSPIHWEQGQAYP